MRKLRWKEFSGVAPRIVPGAIRCSINPRNGSIVFDRATFEKLGEPEAMFLLYEESTRTIGLRKAPLEAANAVQVRERDKRTNRVVRSF